MTNQEITEHDKIDEPSKSERRSFLGIVSGLIAAGISAVLGVTIGRYATAPAFTGAETEKWIELGPIAEIPDGKLVKRNLMVSRQAGWGEFIAKRSVWIVKEGETLAIFSGVCPHLGCAVSASGERFVCACHGSEWDVAGKTLAGPTPRGLDLLEHRIEGKLLKVKYQDFKQGIATKEVAG